MMQNPNLGFHLRKIRKEKALTQYQLAEMSGLSNVTISRIERNRTPHVDINTLVRLADALNVSTDTLLGRVTFLDYHVLNPIREVFLVRMCALNYDKLLTHKGYIVYAVDMNIRLIYANSVFESLFLYNKEELVGKCTEELIAKDSHSISRKMRALKLDGRPITSYQVTALTKDHEPFLLDLTTQHVYQDGRPIGVQGIGRVVDSRVTIDR